MGQMRAMEEERSAEWKKHRWRNVFFERGLLRTGREPLIKIQQRPAILLVLFLVFSACTSEASVPTNNAEQPTTAVAVSAKPNICFITHHEASDPFWDVIERGASGAADVAEVDITYRSGPNGDDQARLIDECVAERPYGIVVSTPDLEAVEDSIDAAKASVFSTRRIVVRISSGLGRTASSIRGRLYTHSTPTRVGGQR